MPDYFVPLDTTVYTRYHRALQARSIVLNANLRYAEKHRKELIKTYGKDANGTDGKGGIEAFIREYEIPQSMIDEIYAEGKKQKVEPKDEAEREQTTKALKMQLKALVARDIWTMTEFYKIMNEDSDIVKCALKQLGEM